MGSKGDGGGGDEDELKHLFEGLYIFHVPPTGAVNPRLHAAYPPLDEHSVVPEDKLALFCFPYDTSHAVGLQRQFFTFGLTTASSALFYGYCLQEQPATPASTAVLFCLVSRLPWHVFFRRLLGVVADSYDVEKGFGSSTFLDALRTAPGVSLSAPLAQAITISPPSQKMVLLHTPDCRRPLVHSALPLVDTLVNRLSAPNLMQVFASLLTERRIIHEETRTV
ncbi:hypothetical protein PTSG_00183 [Salpingoeca rosetta]|uniref:UDENN domain-containing protein n=1 Tax=Salpingoeca rosetta (strain ATCC 50818 / BSB-021) TaxID=946362 RepID=F2TVR6_SALR5|nr:uncharacterized protein PTSG_00183 [Salpingoeca rosetta]EGD72162.1 hypothetical protein PTSG_00183 [Salpingoeca rosetta]|eukprot:XP_004998734.1 hypothetical protein PTSG_00183 [Salpingoeca rosetta]